MPKNGITGILTKIGVTVAALAGLLLLTMAPASAAGADQAFSGVQSAPVSSTEASWDCVITADYGWRWEGSCQGYSGELRTITYCANGTSTVGAWIQARPAPWFVYGNCSGSSWTGIDFQTRG